MVRADEAGECALKHRRAQECDGGRVNSGGMPEVSSCGGGSSLAPSTTGVAGVLTFTSIEECPGPSNPSGSAATSRSGPALARRP